MFQVGNEAKPSMRMRQNRIRSYEDEDQSDSDNTAIGDSLCFLKEIFSCRYEYIIGGVFFYKFL